jgi:hypothetical protein
MHDHLADGATDDGVGDNDLAGKVFAPLAHKRRQFRQLDTRENASLTEVLGVASQRREPQPREVSAVRLLGLQVEVVPNVENVVPVLLVTHFRLVHDHQLQTGEKVKVSFFIAFSSNNHAQTKRRCHDDVRHVEVSIQLYQHKI